MASYSQCPFCGQRSRVPEGSMGASGRCPRCASFYTLVPAEEPAPPRPPTESSTTAPAAVAGAATFLRELEREPAALAPDAAAPAGPYCERPWLEVFGVAALLLAGAGLLAASFFWSCNLVVPVAVVGVLTGLAAVWRACLLGRSRPLLPLAATAVAAALLLAAWRWPQALGPVYQAWRGRPAVDPAALQVVPLPGSQLPHGADPDWVDADQAALRQRGTLVRITRVWLDATDAPGQKLTSAKERGRQLFIRVHIFETKGRKKVPAATSSAGPLPKLTDDAGNVYPFREGPTRPRQRPPKESRLPEYGRDQVFRFAPPPSDISYLRFELPASSAGAPFRFTIPARMIGKAGDP